jgi:hypothetical protein
MSLLICKIIGCKAPGIYIEIFVEVLTQVHLVEIIIRIGKFRPFTLGLIYLFGYKLLLAAGLLMSNHMVELCKNSQTNRNLYKLIIFTTLPGMNLFNF